MGKTYANEKSVIHSGDGEQFIALAPDVCKTPSPGGPVPIPYPNIAMSSDLADGTTSVKVEGRSAALEDSNLKMSSGDEAGSAGGGVVSSKVKGKLTWMVVSTDVKFEGKGVVRFLDSTLHNGNGSNTSGKTKGMMYPGGAGDIMCDNCGKAIGDPSHKQLKPGKESPGAAKKAKAGTKVPMERPMKSALVVKCSGGATSTFSGVAGDQSQPMNITTFPSKYRNLKTGLPLKPTTKQPTDTNQPGNCSEQKSLSAAGDARAYPPGAGCEGTLSVVQEQKEWKRGEPVYLHKESCPTCQRVMTSMMCENEPKK